jgi:hypothetical protein
MELEGILAFKIATPIGFTVRCTQTYWNFIVAHKHPILRGHEEEVKAVLADPEEIRRSRKDSNVLLFYRGGSPRWICAVARRKNGEGFLITAYPTDTVKADEQIWKKSK